MLFHLDRKGFYSFFLLVKTAIEIKNPVCKIHPSSCYWKLRGIQFLKSILPRLMETDFRTFFLLAKTITEIRRNPIFKKYSC